MKKVYPYKHKWYCDQLNQDIVMHFNVLEAEGKRYYYILGCDHENGSNKCTECKRQCLKTVSGD